MNEVINTFIEGMRKDIDKGLMSNKTYLDAHNFRVITTKGSSSGSLENIRGNVILSASTVITSGMRIIGSCEIRDQLVLFATNNTSTTPSGGRSQIYVAEIDLDTETQTSLTLIYDDNLNAGAGSDTLNFSVAYPIKAVSRYETPNIQKVYWTDGYNRVRFCDIGKYLTIDGTAYASAGDYMSTDKFEFLPAFTPSIPTLKDIVSGSLKTGVVQYAYQLYRLNGSETAFSPVTPVIHIVEDGDFLSNTLLYHGSSEQKTTGKGCRLEIVNENDGYDRLRLIRLYYSTLHAVPVISIAAEVEINTTAGTIEVVDQGDTLGELTLDEFNIASTELFSCGDLAIKDNILFASNITKDEFTVDTWDARAVRFKSASTARVFNADDTYIDIDAGLTNWSSYTATHDGINKFNDTDHDGDSNYAWKYQADGTTIGAEGENIKIDFETEEVVIDNSASNVKYHTNPSTSTSDKSYKSYASPWKDGKLSWQRDEVYRLFVVFGNDRGQVSDPKWIIDLRMPSLHDADFTNSSSENVKPSTLASYTSPSVTTYRLYPRVYFKSFPTNASYAQIFRVKRERADRSVVTQGFAIPLRKPVSNYYPDDVDVVLPNNGEMIKLVSPEINITKNISQQSGDFIQYVTNFSSGYTETNVIFSGSTSAFSFGHIEKMQTNTRVAYSSVAKTTIDDTAYVLPAVSDSVDITTIDTKTYNNYCSNSTGGSINAKGCSGLVIAYHDATWSAETVNNVIVNYKCDVFGSQYGGYTYEDRAANVSIPCSGIIKSTQTSTWFDVDRGDTFINYFEVATLLADLSEDKYQDTWSETLYVPLESSVNCDLRHDIEGARNYNIPTSFPDYAPFYRQEYAGEHTLSTHSVDRTFNQTKDLYLYNTVYSEQGSAQYAISLPPDTQNETEFDCMVKASNKKSNGELSDSWTKFGINNFIEVETAHGPINGIYNFNDKLVYFQDKAFGLLSVNDRSLITDNSSAQLVLGTGGVLDRYVYVSNHCGCQDKFSVCTSKSGLYWYDRLVNSIYRYSDNLTNLSKVKELQSYLDANVTSVQSVIALSDIKNDEILFTFYQEGATNGFTISYNEIVDAFVSFYDFVPTIYMPYNFRYLTTTNSYYCSSSFNRDRLFLHDSVTADRCYFYALTTGVAAKYVDSTLKLLFNPEYDYTKVFDNFYYISNAYSSTADIFDDTFTSVRCYNDYQNTDYVTLTVGTNIRRRERGWTLAVPRNAVDDDVSNNPNIFSALDQSQLFKERMRDKYLVADFTYENDGTYDRFVISNMGLRYRSSVR